MSSEDGTRSGSPFGGTNLEYVHRHNQRVVFECLRVNGALSRAELARATGLAKQTVANIIEPLIGDGLLKEDERRVGGRGQPAVPVRISAEGAHAIGVHVDYHRILGVAVDLEGRTIRRSHVYLRAQDAMDVTPILHRMVRSLQRDQPGRYLGLGVATPGPFGTDAATTPGLGIVPGWTATAAESLRKQFGTQTAIENDATAAAAGERRIGAGASIADFAYLYLGIGVGAGLIVDGSLYRGAGRNAGELGLLPQPNASGKTFEQSLSLVALCTQLGWNPYASDTQRRLEALPVGGNAGLEEWIAEARHALALAVLTLEMLFDPECVIVGGLMPKAIVVRLIEETTLLPSVAMRLERKQPRMVAGAGNPWTAAIGAAASTIASAFDPEFRILQKI